MDENRFILSFLDSSGFRFFDHFQTAQFSAFSISRFPIQIFVKNISNAIVIYISDSVLTCHVAGRNGAHASFCGSSFVGQCTAAHAGVPIQGGKQEPQLDKVNLRQTDVEGNGQRRLVRAWTNWCLFFP